MYLMWTNRCHGSLSLLPLVVLLWSPVTSHGDYDPRNDELVDIGDFNVIGDALTSQTKDSFAHYLERRLDENQKQQEDMDIEKASVLPVLTKCLHMYDVILSRKYKLPSHSNRKGKRDGTDMSMSELAEFITNNMKQRNGVKLPVLRFGGK